MDDQLLARLLDCHRPLPPDPEHAWARQGPIGLPDFNLGVMRDWLMDRLIAAASVLSSIDYPGQIDWPQLSASKSSADDDDPLTIDDGNAEAA